MNLLSLLGVVFASGTLTLTQPQFRNNDTYQDVDVTTTYEYETNEVNSVSDLVEGNIYKFQYNAEFGFGEYVLGLNDTNVIDIVDYNLYKIITDDNGANRYSYFSVSNLNNIDNFSLEEIVSTYDFSVNLYTDDIDDSENFGITSSNGSSFVVTFYFVLIALNDNTSFDVTYVSASDYLGEETTTITSIETEGFYNIFYQFLNDRIFTGGYMDSMSSTILGQTITLGNWCSITFSLIILTLILVFLIKFVIYLFKVVSSLFLWR